MGGSPGILWRGTTVSQDMYEPLNELARLAGDDIYVRPIAGFGSYSGNSNSADIDNGGGHVDINLVGYTDTQKKRLEALARMIGFYADIREPKWYSPIRRKWLSMTWQSHLHMLKKDTTDLSDAARKQLNLWYAGFNGLAGFSWGGVWTYDADDGPRQYLRQTWTQYKERTMGEVLSTDTTTTLSGSVATAMAKKDGTRWNVVGLIKYAAAGFFDVHNRVIPMQLSQNKAIAELRGMIAGQTQLINQLAGGSDIDLATITKAVTDAARIGALEGASEAAPSIEGEYVLVRAEDNEPSA